MKHLNFCYEGHKHDALCDPTLAEPRVEPNSDPAPQNHRRFMEATNQAGWLGWQLTRPLTESVGKRKAKPRKTASVPVKKRR